MHIKRFIYLSKPKQLKTTFLGIVDNAIRVWKSADAISAIEVDAGYRERAIDDVKWELEKLDGRMDDVEDGDHFPDQNEQEQAIVALWKVVNKLEKEQEGMSKHLLALEINQTNLDAVEQRLDNTLHLINERLNKLEYITKVKQIEKYPDLLK
jgi:hypothetical protein